VITSRHSTRRSENTIDFDGHFQIDIIPRYGIYKKVNLALHLDPPKVIWRQVADQVREKILSGNLVPGVKLPSTTVLAEQSGTDAKTVHRALSELVREGLITRTRKIGTHVAVREATLTRIGVYHDSNIQKAQHSLYLQCLNAELQNRAHQSKLKMRVWMDFRPTLEQDTVLPEIEKATREREIQGLIITVGDPIHAKWLSKLRVPVAYLGGSMSTSVNWDILDFVKKSVKELRRLGCPSAGCICPFQNSPANKLHKTFHERFLAECRANGIATDDRWISTPTASDSHPDENSDYFPEQKFEEFGYHAFNRVWSAPSRPAGLVVYPDGIARGVVMAAVSRHINIPKELKLILHKNEEITLLCPVPATFITSSVQEVCITLLERLDDAFHGRPTSRTELHFQVERNESSMASHSRRRTGLKDKG